MGLLTLLTGRMPRADARAWGSARTLADLGELTARWLEGTIKSQPGYYGPCDVDEDDAPGMTATLIALCRAGYVTDQSQAGCVAPGYDGAGWEQRAAVQGFAGDDTLDWLSEALRPTRFRLFAHPVKGAWRRAGKGVTVTTRAGRAYTGFGGQRGRADIDLWFGAAGNGAAVDAACAAWQVTIYDPEFGPNDLWPVLHSAALANTNA